MLAFFRYSGLAVVLTGALWIAKEGYEAIREFRQRWQEISNRWTFIRETPRRWKEGVRKSANRRWEKAIDKVEKARLWVKFGKAGGTRADIEEDKMKEKVEEGKPESKPKFWRWWSRNRSRMMEHGVEDSCSSSVSTQSYSQLVNYNRNLFNSPPSHIKPAFPISTHSPDPPRGENPNPPLHIT